MPLNNGRPNSKGVNSAGDTGRLETLLHENAASCHQRHMEAERVLMSLLVEIENSLLRAMTELQNFQRARETKLSVREPNVIQMQEALEGHPIHESG
jgi:hypothetical protein